MPNTKNLFIHKPNSGRRFAISDIHGCSKTFKALLSQISLQPADQLFLLGDYVNRGPDSAGVIDHILLLQSQNYNIFCLKGNHEELLLQAENKKSEKAYKIFKENNSLGLLDKDNKIKKVYKQFMESCMYFIELDDYFLVHAGFDFHADKPFENYKAMMNIPKFKAKKKWLKGKKVIHGHNPRNLSTIMKKIKKEKRKIHIDNGCANVNSKEQGNLLCFNLDTKAIIVQQNIESKEEKK